MTETGALEGMSAAHNAERTAVGVAALTWSNQIAGYATEWAKHLANQNGCTLAHRSNTTYGENLFWTTTPRTAAYVASAWAAEKANYDHSTNSCSGSTCGHYTQMIWSSTKSIGCGMAPCANGKQIWVCNYDPRGNLQGQSPY